AAEVDLVHGGVALAGRDAILGRVLGRHDADAIGRAGGCAQRAADALLESRVLEAVELVAAAGAGIDPRLLLPVLEPHRAFHDPRERRLQPTQGLAESTVGAGHGAGGGAAHDLDDVGSGVVGVAHVATTIAVTRRLSVASGRRIFHPSDISWS